MIPQAYITEWSAHVPWKTNEQVEHDLVFYRALVEIYRDDFLAGHKWICQPLPLLIEHPAKEMPLRPSTTAGA